MTRKKLLWSLPIVLVMAASACDGGGLGCSCMDMQPIPGGYPRDRMVENAIQARLTPNAITFLESNVDSLVTMFVPEGLDFPIDPMTTSIDLVGDVEICQPSGCMAHIQLIGVDIIPTPPNVLRAVAQVHFWVDGNRDGHMSVDIQPGLLCWLPCFGFSPCDCNVDFDTAASGAPYNTFALNVNFDVDDVTRFTGVSITDAGLTDTIETGDIGISSNSACGSVICSLASLDFIKGFFIDTLTSSLMDTLGSTLSEFTCRTCGDTGCPAGSTCDGGTPDDFCMYPDGTCVPMMLGMEGRMDVGSLLSSFSPSAEGEVDFLAAAGGYAAVEMDGVDLGVLGGLSAVEHDACVHVMPVPCDTSTDCAPGYTCGYVPEEDVGLFTCRRCGLGCPAGSTPSEKCLPDGPDDTEYNPTAVCIDDASGECVRIAYCTDTSGALQASAAPPRGPVHVADALKVDSFSHCRYCPTGTECTAPFACDAEGVCTDAGGSCEMMTESVMAVVGVSETFLRNALFGFVDSGAACEEAYRESWRWDNVVWGTQPVAMVLKPRIAYYGNPSVELDRLDSPDVVLGDDTALTISLNNVTLDLYAWVEETYSRFETVSIDLTLGVDLEVHDNMLYPVIRDPKVVDVRVTNTDLLDDDRETLETLFGGVIEMAMGFLPPLEPIEIPELSGFVLRIPDGGITHVSEAGEDFLTLYAQLELAPPAPAPLATASSTAETTLEVVAARIPPVRPDMGTAEQYSKCEKPEFEVGFGATGGREDPAAAGRPYEYRYRVDGSWWSRWSRNETALVTRRSFVFQGKHMLEVQARVAGLPETEDPTPAATTLIVDGLGPAVEVTRVRDTLEVRARDLVSPDEALTVSWHLEGESTTHRLVPPLALDVAGLEPGSRVVIEAVDEAGNMTTETYSIRGRPPGTGDTSSCGSCMLSGREGAPAVLGILVVLGLLAGLRIGMGRRSGRGWREDPNP